MVVAQGGELVDGDRCRKPGRFRTGQAIPGRAHEVLDGERAELRGQLAVDAGVEAEQDHVPAVKPGAQVDRRLRAPARHQIGPGAGFAEQCQPGAQPAGGADLIAGEAAQVVLHALGQRSRHAAQRRGQPPRLHQRHHLVQPRRRPRAPGMEHLDRGLDVALGRALVVGLGEALGRDQLVLERRGVAVGQWVPVAGAVRGPDPQAAPRRRGGALQRRGERRRALHVDRDHRAAPVDLRREDAEHRRRLARPARAHDQGVRGELVVRQRHRPAAGVAAQHHRAVGLATRAAGAGARHGGANQRGRQHHGQAGGEQSGRHPHRGRPQHRDVQRQAAVAPRGGAAAGLRAHRAASGARRRAPARSALRPGCGSPARRPRCSRGGRSPARAGPGAAPSARWRGPPPGGPRDTRPRRCGDRRHTR